eukprot:s1998_g13.t1
MDLGTDYGYASWGTGQGRSDGSSSLDEMIPTPKGLSFEDWCKTLVTMPKYKKEKISFSELYSKAAVEAECRKLHHGDRCKISSALVSTDLNSATFEPKGIGVQEWVWSVGPAENTGLWPKKFSPASLSVPDLFAKAKEQRKTLTYRYVVFFEEEIAEAVWKQTMEEVAKGEIEGPLDIFSVPQHYPLSRRFGVK